MFSPTLWAIAQVALLVIFLLLIVGRLFHRSYQQMPYVSLS